MTKRSGNALKTLFMKAVGAHQAGRATEAERLYTKVLQADPEQFDTLRLFGHLELQRGRPEPASKLLTRALRANPDSHEVLGTRGIAWLELGQPARAVVDFEKALALAPDSPGSLANLGSALVRLGRGEEGLAAYDRALAMRPDDVQGLYNRGCVLLDLGLNERAIVDFEAALALRPDYAEAAHNLGLGLRAMRGAEPALAAFDRALAIRPAYPDALNSKGIALRELGRHAEAAVVFAELLKVDSTYPYAPGSLLDAKLRDCDWSTFEADLAAVRSGVSGHRRATAPFTLLASIDDPALQLECGRTFVENDCPEPAAPLWRDERYHHSRIRVAYVSGDFGDHPVAHLIAEVLERHDRDRFELVAISLRKDASGEMRTRLVRAFDEFLDVQDISDLEVAQLMRSREIDIAVDLMGFTLGNRMRVFSHRPAPVQVNYLGYSGTTGAGFMDYILADRIVIPGDSSAHFSEHVVSLPDLFLANSARSVAPRTPDRAELGLPDTGFVFCSFNNSFKILPHMFRVWMRLLLAVGGSVLWLGTASRAVKDNLCREAAQAGIDPERLVFAPRMERIEDHLARYRCADLFVDTLPYNGHTTVSDALTAGLPVITCMGRSFASRVAGSLLNAAGLQELVTGSLEEYESLALRLAMEPDLLSSLRMRLRNNSASFPLFDCASFTRSIEAAYIRMWERAERGEPPEAFAL